MLFVTIIVLLLFMHIFNNLFYTHFSYTFSCMKIHGYYNLFIDYAGKISLCTSRSWCAFSFVQIFFCISQAT